MYDPEADCIFAVTVTRWSRRDHTFSDGTFIPAGTLIAAPSAPLHYDDKFYENSQEWDPFRFEKLADSNISRRQFTSTDTKYIPFGHGE
jgi:cytochrome P450